MQVKLCGMGLVLVGACCKLLGWSWLCALWGVDCLTAGVREAN